MYLLSVIRRPHPFIRQRDSGREQHDPLVGIVSIERVDFQRSLELQPQASEQLRLLLSTAEKLRPGPGMNWVSRGRDNPVQFVLLGTRVLGSCEDPLGFVDLWFEV